MQGLRLRSSADPLERFADGSACYQKCLLLLFRQSSIKCILVGDVCHREFLKAEQLQGD